MTKEDAFAQVGKTAVLQNVHGIMTFLINYPPFSQMETGHLAWLVEHSQLRFFAKGESIIRPQEGPVQHFYVVKQGRVRGERMLAGQDEPDTTFEISAGECFPLAALIGERATRTEHVAADDTFCLTLPRADFGRLFGMSTPFRDFALRGVSSLLDQVNQQVQAQAAETLGAGYSFDTRLSELALRNPVSCAPYTSIRQAVRQMDQASVGSIVVVDQQDRALGIFTLRDLRRIIAEQTADMDDPVCLLYTSPSPRDRQKSRMPSSA